MTSIIVDNDNESNKSNNSNIPIEYKLETKCRFASNCKSNDCWFNHKTTVLYAGSDHKYWSICKYDKPWDNKRCNNPSCKKDHFVNWITYIKDKRRSLPDTRKAISYKFKKNNLSTSDNKIDNDSELEIKKNKRDIVYLNIFNELKNNSFEFNSLKKIILDFKRIMEKEVYSNKNKLNNLDILYEFEKLSIQKKILKSKKIDSSYNFNNENKKSNYNCNIEVKDGDRL